MIGLSLLGPKPALLGAMATRRLLEGVRSYQFCLRAFCTSERCPKAALHEGGFRASCSAFQASSDIPYHSLPVPLMIHKTKP